MAESQRDHYEVLGVSRQATADEIKGAFRKLAAQYHPDRNPDDPSAAARFKEVNAAYQVLSDSQRRAVYDRFGHQGEGAGSPFGPGGPFAGGVVDLGDIALDGILGDLLGVFGDSEETGKPAGDDLREGKRTVLLALARERATAVDRDHLDALVGNPQLDANGVDIVRDILDRTGARTEVEARIRRNRDHAIAALDSPAITPIGTEMLLALADAATNRSA